MSDPRKAAEGADAQTLASRSTTERPPTDAFVLMVSAGPDRGAMFEGPAVGARAIVGTSPVCDFRLTDPEVSRRHVALEIDSPHLRLIELGSTNGTFVNDVRVRDALLFGGETVRIGATHLRVERSLPQRGPKPSTRVSFGGVLGASLEMRRLYGVWERVAASDIPVILEGETGTGKEELAEALHEAGPRAAGPFVVFDCTTVAPTLVESELFGHERGAFTGAVAPRVGLFEQADGGTLLIDEIGDMDAASQPKLLRAVERKEIRRVGGSQSIRVDVRVIAATRRDLDALVQRGVFRDDLFHRLAVARIELPPLRRRRGDVTLLARHFCEELGAKPDLIAPEVYRRWEEYDWPGNVRELRNAVARHLALGDMPSDEEPAPHEVPRGTDPFEAVLDLHLPYVQARHRVQEAFEGRYLARVLEENQGNVRRAAAAAGVGRRYFQRLRAKAK